MITYGFLVAAILAEVVGTLALKVASMGRPKWYIATATAYVLAFVMLSAAMDRGLGLGVAYGIWAAVGVSLTAVASRVFFEEPPTPIMASGIGLIAAGVLFIELGTAH